MPNSPDLVLFSLVACSCLFAAADGYTIGNVVTVRVLLRTFGSSISSEELPRRRFLEQPTNQTRPSWQSWAAWECYLSHGKCYRRRFRDCSTGVDNDCERFTTTSLYGSQVMPCGGHTCPGDGGWGSWRSWGTCSVTCDGGVRKRHRLCDNPVPHAPGRDCTGNATQTGACNTVDCPRPYWQPWAAWECYQLHGKCNMRRFRDCSTGVDNSCERYNPTGLSGVQVMSCDGHACPGDGGWGSWQSWGTCSVTCDDGVRQRHRLCDNPAPQAQGRNCAGNATQTGECNTVDCPRPYWQPWAAWECYQLHGKCNMRRFRDCSTGIDNDCERYNPTGLSGVQVMSCVGHVCPGDGGWGSWQSWGTCSVSCDGGVRQRHRLCDNPAPQAQGRNCAGNATQTETCHIVDCPRPYWQPWAAWGCYQLHGKCNMRRFRDCSTGVDNDCERYNPGLSGVQVMSCVGHTCPGDGGWGNWQSWDTCSVTCDDGVSQRHRLCDNPAPHAQGRNCTGNSTQTETCHTVDCPRDGGWGSWQAWWPCSVTCDDGIRQRHRGCDHAQGRNCTGNATQTEKCHMADCPSSNWSSWFYSPCTGTCGTGTRQGLRSCSSGHVEDCAGSAMKTETCTASPCPVDGGWGSWQQWDPCSLTCGQGSRSRHRVCDSPVPSNGGNGCHGDSTQGGACNSQDCPHWGVYHQTSACSVTCGQDWGAYRQTSACSVTCGQDWGPYYQTSACSVTCGQGVEQLTRNCSTGNSHDCTGSAYDERPCTRPAC